MWGGFRVARRARPLGLEIQEEADFSSVSCTHDGYKRLPGIPVHSRRWEFGDGQLEVQDSIRGEYHEAVAYYHLHPDVRVQFNAGATEGSLELPEGQSVRWLVTGGEVGVEETTYHPGFGLAVMNQTIKVIFTGNEVVYALQWIAL